MLNLEHFSDDRIIWLIPMIAFTIAMHCFTNIAVNAIKIDNKPLALRYALEAIWATAGFAACLIVLGFK